jgi:hypothetical protein
MLKQFIVFWIVVIFLIGCGSGSQAGKDASNSNVKVLAETFDDIGLEQLNRYRNFAGMTGFSINKSLTMVAQNHASYQIENNLYTHDEQNKTLSQRAIEAGYTYNRDISENIYAGNVTPESSIDILFSNIYHRLAFLDFGFDEIGFGMGVSDDYAFKKVYTYEMGRANSRLSNENQNPKIVLWPYENQQNVMPVFYEELPDPLPECSVSGYPISIQFNPAKNGKIKLASFALYDDLGEVVDSKLLRRDQHLSDKEFVLMPLTRLKWGTTYHVKALYSEDNSKNKLLEWDFNTKSLPEPYFIVKDTNQNYTIKSGETYHFYLPPKDCNDKFNTYTYKYSYGLKVEERMVDNNTMKFKITGSGTVEIKTDNGKKIILTVN